MFIRKPRSEKTTLSTLDMCNKEHILYEMKIIKNFFIKHIPGIELIVKAYKIDNNYYFYVFTLDLGCICFCEFININAFKNIYKLQNYENLYEPHCDTHPDFRYYGLASSIYTYFLLNAPQAVLMTSKHTKLAVKLWESVCSKINGKIIYHNPVTGKEQMSPTKSNIKLLIKNVKELSDSKM